MSQKSTQRPALGVALGGGAARGWAHIGVLKTLHAAGLRPEVIVGTSIGAVVGGCYAAGKLDELEEFARSLTLRNVIRQLDFTLPGSGLINGEKIAKKLAEHLSHLAIGDLSARYVAVATELGTGQEVWLNRGPVVAAMRASYALPGIFKPVRVNGRWLMDGAFVNPVPVSPCRAMGARYVIAVNLHNTALYRNAPIAREEAADEMEPSVETRDLRPKAGLDPVAFLRRKFFGRREETPGITRVMLEAFNITQDRIARSRLAGDPPDITISPRLDALGLFDFHRADFAIAQGEAAAQRYLEEIRRSEIAAFV